MSQREQTLQAAFDGVNARDPDAIMAVWSRDGVYDNPMVGPASRGFDAVRERMVQFCAGIEKRGERLVVDRMTPGPTHLIAEWHVEPRNGKDGIHIAEFDAAGKLVHVKVFPRG